MVKTGQIRPCQGLDKSLLSATLHNVFLYQLRFKKSSFFGTRFGYVKKQALALEIYYRK